MKKIITMISIVSMLCSTIGATNYEVAKAEDAAGSVVDTVSGGAIEQEGQTPSVSPQASPMEVADTDEGDFIIDYYKSGGEKIWYISEYIGNSSIVVIPDEYKGNKIEEILSDAFYHHTELESVKLPKSLKLIEESAFEGCTNLKEIEIPDTVEKISAYAFQGCESLKNVRLPKALNKMKYNSFWDTGVEEFTIDDENATFTAVDGAIYDKKCTQLVMVPPRKSKLELPETVTQINRYAVYENKMLTEVNLPASLTTIETYAFKSCTALRKVEFPSTLETIKESAFENCGKLEEVELPDTLKTFGKFVFKGCSALKKVKLPNTLETMKESMFEDCSALKEVKLPNTLKTFGKSVFKRCSALKEVKLPNTLKTIGVSAFEDCSALKEVNLPNTLKNIYSSAFAGCSALSEVKFPNAITCIGGWSFKDCKKIKDIMIPASVTYLDNSAFVGCNNVKTFKINNKNKNYSTSEGNLYNKSKTIFYAPVTMKKTVTLLKTVKKVSSDAFIDHENIKKIKVKKGNEYFSIYDNALYNKEKTMLYACPEGKTSLILPATLTTFGTGEFPYDDFDILEGCKLKKIQVKTANKKYSSYKGVLYNKKMTEILYVPMNIKSLVFPKTLTNISELSDNCAKVTSIAVNAGNKKFQVIDGILYNKKLTKVLFCIKNKKKVVLPETVKSIETMAFWSCKKLKKITLSENLNYVGFFAFENCESLEYVKFPDRAVTIATLAFVNCSQLKWVYVPKKVYFFEYCERHIFAGCNKLSDIYYAGTVEEWNKCWDEEGTDFKEYEDSFGEYMSILFPETFPGLTIHYEAEAPL